MDELIHQLETAAEGSRELDAAIAGICAAELGWTMVEGTGSHISRHWQRYENSTLTISALCFTNSLDTALQLVPEGWNWLVRKSLEERTAFANVSALNASNLCDTWDSERGCFVGNGPGHNYGRASTPALALCAAALKARS